MGYILLSFHHSGVCFQKIYIIWLSQILSLLADTLIEIQEQVLGCEDEVIMLP